MSTYSCWVDYITPKSLMCLIYNLRSSVCLNSAKWTHAKHQSTAGGTFDSLRASPRVLCLVSRRARPSVSLPQQRYSHRYHKPHHTLWKYKVTANSGEGPPAADTHRSAERYSAAELPPTQAGHTPTVCRDVSMRSATGSQPLSPEPSAWWQSSVELSRVKDTLCLQTQSEMCFGETLCASIINSIACCFLCSSLFKVIIVNFIQSLNLSLYLAH